MDNISSVLLMNVHVTSLHHSSNYVVKLAEENTSSYVCVSNVHMCMEVFDNEDFRNIVNSADLIVPDGRPIFWAQKILGFKNSKQVRGQDLMSELCSLSSNLNLNIGLYGGSSEIVLNQVKTELLRSNPHLSITYTFSPPFADLSDVELQEISENINKAKVNILFVGIGCPKQEIWMAAQKGRANCVMIGVGAAFDFVSGSKTHAPRWMQYLGMEWLFRLFSEPKRLWRRYLLQNPRFIYFFLKQFMIGLK